MEQDRLKLWLSFLKFLLGSFAVSVVTIVANHQIQERELAMKEQDNMAHFLDQALTQDVGLRRRFAQYFANVTRSDDLRARWESYLKVVEIEYGDTQEQLAKAEREVSAAIQTTARVSGDSDVSPSLILDQKVAKVEELRDALRVKPASPNDQITPRVYIHIRSNAQREIAAQLGSQLASALEVVVPGVQRVTSGPNATELRYFNSANKAEAKTIASFLQQQSGVQVEAAYVSGYENSSLIRPRHYELWFSSDALVK